MTITELLAEASKALPPQRPSRSKYAKFKPVFLILKEKGYHAEDMAQWLIARKEVETEKLDSCRRSIHQLLKKHAPKAIVTPMSAAL